MIICVDIKIRACGKWATSSGSGGRFLGSKQETLAHNESSVHQHVLGWGQWIVCSWEGVIIWVVSGE